MKNAHLSKREKEILSYISSGFTSKEIANNLKISKRTVDNLRGRILEKIGTSSLAGVISYSIISTFF